MPEGSERIYLLVEDNADDAILIRLAFKPIKLCRTVLCRTIREAQTYLRDADGYGEGETYPLPNAILSDLHLGNDSGIDLIVWMKGNPRLKRVPIFVLTGTASALECAEALEAGALEVLEKPSRHEDLKSILVSLAAKVELLPA